MMSKLPEQRLGRALHRRLRHGLVERRGASVGNRRDHRREENHCHGHLARRLYREARMGMIPDVDGALRRRCGRYQCCEGLRQRRLGILLEWRSPQKHSSNPRQHLHTRM